MKGLILADGGTFEQLNLAPAIEKCKEEGVEDEDIIVDVIFCTDPSPFDEWTKE